LPSERKKRVGKLGKRSPNRRTGVRAHKVALRDAWEGKKNLKNNHVQDVKQPSTLRGQGFYEKAHRDKESRKKPFGKEKNSKILPRAGVAGMPRGACSTKRLEPA